MVEKSSDASKETTPTFEQEEDEMFDMKSTMVSDTRPTMEPEVLIGKVIDEEVKEHLPLFE